MKLRMPQTPATDLHLDAVPGLPTKRDPAVVRPLREKVPPVRHRVPTASGSPAGGECGNGAVGQRGSQSGGPRSPTRNIPGRSPGIGVRSPGYTIGGPQWPCGAGLEEHGAAEAPRYPARVREGPTKPRNTTRGGARMPYVTVWEGHGCPTLIFGRATGPDYTGWE